MQVLVIQILPPPPALLTLLPLIDLHKYFRFGLILFLRILDPVKKGEEIFVDYRIEMKKAPKWYCDEYIKFAEEKPFKADKDIHLEAKNCLNND